MPDFIIFRTNEYVTWMCVAVNETVFKYHGCEDIYEIPTDLFRIYVGLYKLVFLTHFDTMDKFHH
jgi:hypothetical protein